MNDICKTIPKKQIIIWKPYLHQFSAHFFDCYQQNGYKIICCPWATDLLPNEIEYNIKNLAHMKSKQVSNFVGMPLAHLEAYKECMNTHNIKYTNYGGTFDKDSKHNKTTNENMLLIQESIIAPALQTDLQIRIGYIPCRIFKNISYGKMGMTNNMTVYKLFNEKILYSTNIEELVTQGLDFENKSDKNTILEELMREIKDKHTYINRMEFIFNNI